MRIFLYGRLDPTPTPFPLVSCKKRALSIGGYTLWEIVLDHVFTLDDIVAAHVRMDANQANGKLVVKVIR